MSSNNEENGKFNSLSYDNENDSINTYFSNENYYPLLYQDPYINISGNGDYSLFNPNYSYSIFSEYFKDFKDLEYHLESNHITNKSMKFTVLLKQGRGPRPKNGYLDTKRHRHLNTHFDNLQIKIQVHFISFIINLSNDVLFSVFKENKKYKVNQEIKVL